MLTIFSQLSLNKVVPTLLKFVDELGSQSWQITALKNSHTVWPVKGVLFIS